MNRTVVSRQGGLSSLFRKAVNVTSSSIEPSTAYHPRKDTAKPSLDSGVAQTVDVLEEETRISTHTPLSSATFVRKIVFPGPTDLQIQSLRAEVYDALTMINASLVFPSSLADYLWTSRRARVPSLKSIEVRGVPEGKDALDFVERQTAAVAASNEVRRRMELLESSTRDLVGRAQDVQLYHRGDQVSGKTQRTDGQRLLIQSLLGHSSVLCALGRYEEGLGCVLNVLREAQGLPLEPIATQISEAGKFLRTKSSGVGDFADFSSLAPSAGMQRSMILVHMLAADILVHIAIQKYGFVSAPKIESSESKSVDDVPTKTVQSLLEDASLHMSRAKILLESEADCAADQIAPFPLTGSPPSPLVSASNGASSPLMLPLNPAEIFLRIGIFESSCLKDFDTAARTLTRGMDLANGTSRYRNEIYTNLDLCVCYSVALARIGVATAESDLADFAYESAMKQCSARPSGLLNQDGETKDSSSLSAITNSSLAEVSKGLDPFSRGAAAQDLGGREKYSSTPGEHLSLLNEVELLFDYGAYLQHVKKAPRSALELYETALRVIPALLATHAARSAQEPDLFRTPEEIESLKFLYGSILFNAGLAYERELSIGAAQATVVFSEALKLFVGLGLNDQTVKVRLHYARALLKSQQSGPTGGVVLENLGDGSKADLALEQLIKAASLVEAPTELKTRLSLSSDGNNIASSVRGWMAKKRQIDKNGTFSLADPVEVYGHLGHCLQYHVFHLESAVSAFTKALACAEVIKQLEKDGLNLSLDPIVSDTLKVHPKTLAWVQEHTAKLHMRRGDFKAAARLWTQRIELAKDHASIVDFRQAAKKEQSSSDPSSDQAAMIAKRAERTQLQMSSFVPIPWFEASMNLAICLSRRGEFIKQAMIYKDLIDIRKTPEATKSQRYEALQQYAALCQSTHQYAKAAELFEILLRVESQNPHLLIQLAVCKQNAAQNLKSKEALVGELSKLYRRACAVLDLRRHDNSFEKLVEQRQQLNSEALSRDRVTLLRDGATDERLREQEKIHEVNDAASVDLFQWRQWDTCYVYGEAAVFFHEKTSEDDFAATLYQKALSRTIEEEAVSASLTTYPYIAANYAVLLFDKFDDRAGAEFWFERAIEAGRYKEKIENERSRKRASLQNEASENVAFSPAAYNASSLFIGYLSATKDFPRAISHLKEMISRFPTEASRLHHKIAKIYENEVDRDVLIPLKGRVEAEKEWQTQRTSTPGKEGKNRVSAKKGKKRVTSRTVFDDESQTLRSGSITPNEEEVLWSYVKANQEAIRFWSGSRRASAIVSAASSPPTAPSSSLSPDSCSSQTLLSKAHILSVMWSPHRQVVTDFLRFLTTKIRDYSLAKECYQLRCAIGDMDPLLVTGFARLLTDNLNEPLAGLQVLEKCLVPSSMTLESKKRRVGLSRRRKLNLLKVTKELQKLNLDPSSFVGGNEETLNSKEINQATHTPDKSKSTSSGSELPSPVQLEPPPLLGMSSWDKETFIYDVRRKAKFQLKAERETERFWVFGSTRTSSTSSGRIGVTELTGRPNCSLQAKNPVLLDHYAEILSQVIPKRRDVGELVHLRNYSGWKLKYRAMLQTPSVEASNVTVVKQSLYQAALFFAAYLSYSEPSYERAVALYKEAVELQPDDISAVHCLASFMCFSARKALAIPPAKKVSSRNECDPLHDETKLVSEAKTWCQKCIGLAPPQAGQYRAMYAHFLWSIGDLSGAWDVFEEGLQASPEDLALVRGTATFLTERLVDLTTNDPLNSSGDQGDDVTRTEKEADASDLSQRLNFVSGQFEDRHRMILVTQKLYDKAFAVSMKDVNTLAWYANFLSRVKNDKAAAEAVREAIRQVEGSVPTIPGESDDE